MEDLDLFRSEKLSKAVESLAEAVIVTDPGGEIAYVNPAFETITGYSAEEAIGKNPRILKSGMNPPELYAGMWATLLKGAVWRGNVVNRRKDGSTYNAQLTISPIRTDTGRVINYVAVQHEVTRQLRAEEQVRLRAEEYKALHDVAKTLQTADGMEAMLRQVLKDIVGFGELKAENKAGIFLADPERRVLKLFVWIGDFTPEFLERDKEVPYGDCLCGRSAAEGEMLVSSNCFTDPRHERRFEGMTAHGHYIVPLKSRGKLVGVMFLYTHEDPPWYERSQEILRSIGGLIADAIERRRAEEEIVEKNRILAGNNDKLKELNDLKIELLGVAAHDLRNPLYLVNAYSRALSEGDYLGPLNEKQRKLVRDVYSAGQEMEVLLNNLLDISKIESGKIGLEKAVGDFNDLARRRVELNRAMAHDKRIEIQTDLQPIPPFAFDRMRIIQAVDNLIGNAVKFSPPGSKVVVSAGRAGKTVRFEVRDEGPGISEEERKLLFGTFRTLSAKPTGGERSSGLGLAIVKKNIVLHGGEVGVSSQLGKGSVFFFLLPCE